MADLAVEKYTIEVDGVAPKRHRSPAGGHGIGYRGFQSTSKE
jgi:hypothetical protein